jgi:hypothetical protein
LAMCCLRDTLNYRTARLPLVVDDRALFVGA